jgi:hypothetical protein
VLRSVAHFQTSDGSDFLSIDPSALPSGIGVSIFDEPGNGFPTRAPKPAGTTPKSGTSPLRGSIHPPAGITGPLAIGLVYASQQCTG